jgi:hypothetical protein
MANNRLFIFNKESNQAMLFAKAFGEWSCRVSADEVNEFLSIHDWDSACYGSPSNFTLLTEDELPENVTYFTYDTESKRKAIEAMERVNAMFAPKKHVPFKKKLEERKKGRCYAL